MFEIIEEYIELLLNLLSSIQLPLNDNLRSSLPEKGGVYRIFEKESTWSQSIYIGKTENLRNRIYHDHFMGNRIAGVKGKLIKSGQFNDEESVKEYFKEKCLVQFVIINDESLRALFEHFAISILRPQFND